MNRVCWTNGRDAPFATKSVADVAIAIYPVNTAEAGKCSDHLGVALDVNLDQLRAA